MKNLQNSVHQGLDSPAEELITSLRVVRQPSLLVVSSTRRSHDWKDCRGLIGFVVEALSRSSTSTDLTHLSAVVIALDGV